MRIGIIAFLHESNTFSFQKANLESFQRDLLLSGLTICERMADSHHEVGGFFAGLAEASAQAVPLIAARTLPCGTIESKAFDTILSQIIDSLCETGDLDGILVAPHGATVSEEHPDADGYWLNEVRQSVGKHVPIVGTLDAHANLSPLMVNSCDALVAYRTNPHLDQRARGIEAARLLTSTIREEILPVMEARFPPLAIGIARQCTEEPHLRPLYDFADGQLAIDGVLTNSILLGFPYADVSEMGSSVLVVTDDDRALAKQLADELAAKLWSMRSGFEGEFTSIQTAVEACRNSSDRICLLDMGDNVGGGSSADATHLFAALACAELERCFCCLCDPEAVEICDEAGIGNTLQITVGGKTDALHGQPLTIEGRVRSLHHGKFQEPEPRHGGIVEFDQGLTAVFDTKSGLTLMLTSRRMVPFSLQQLISCDLDPTSFRILVAKGVNAPIAAYREVCKKFIRVNTPGSTCADMTQLPYKHRRRPMFPFEHDAIFGGDSS